MGPHTHQLKNSELPQNEKKNFLLQINTKFRPGGTKKFCLIVMEWGHYKKPTVYTQTVGFRRTMIYQLLFLVFKICNRTRIPPQSINPKEGIRFLFTYIRTAVPLTATINIPARIIA
ncbi:hypothetical protein FOR95_13475 [Bacillus anthracis]|nr:hypothetical protein BG02_5863 [Bacillus anthracis]KFL79732.1 hypothetical protein DJ49_5825 [Bacillus anthracis]MDR4296263.1 hypothetical protein [Bacillus anthracis]MDR4313801.1 hypothetical protein [Bacillus anthracis]MDR4382843.1 hypothetical protein [Bacillus anthracis]